MALTCDSVAHTHDAFQDNKEESRGSRRTVQLFLTLTVLVSYL